jgi:hypothetical protein
MITHEPPSGAVAPLPLWATAAQGYRLVAGNLGTLARVAALPFVLFVVINATATHFGPLVYSLVWEFGVELPWTLMAVAWLRVLLLGPASADAVFFPRLRQRHLRFLGYALMLSALHLPLTFFADPADALALEGTQRTIVYWALYLLILYLSLRLSFVYAAVAVDETYSLAVAWRHTRGISFALFIVVGLGAMLPWLLFSWLLGQAIEADPGTAFALGMLWHAALWVPEALYLAIIAIAFRTCTGWVPAPDQRVLERFD